MIPEILLDDVVVLGCAAFILSIQASKLLFFVGDRHVHVAAMIDDESGFRALRDELFAVAELLPGRRHRSKACMPRSPSNCTAFYESLFVEAQNRPGWTGRAALAARL